MSPVGLGQPTPQRLDLELRSVPLGPDRGELGKDRVDGSGEFEA